MQGIGIEIPSPLREQASRWSSLKRWERRELGQALRRLGLSYREISDVIPVTKGTMSGWCRDLQLTDAQRERLIRRSGGQPGHHQGARTNHERREAQISEIRRMARIEAEEFRADRLWLAGVMLYWGEGSKSKHVCVTNSDPELIRIMMRFFREILGLIDDRFVLRLHLHSGQDEQDCQGYWAEVAGLPTSSFGKTYWKAEGSGHRKRILYRGTVQVVVRSSGDLLHRMLAWIESCYHLAGPLAQLARATDS